ncbi:MAG: hypothetical protein ACPLWC_05300, partial [Candidatus Woesearchaeota archaeon]
MIVTIYARFVKAYFPDDCSGACNGNPQYNVTNCAKNGDLCECIPFIKDGLKDYKWISKEPCSSSCCRGGKTACKVNNVCKCVDTNSDSDNCGSCG